MVPKLVFAAHCAFEDVIATLAAVIAAFDTNGEQLTSTKIC